MKQNEISEFYDEYAQRQLKIGANERLISLYKRLLNGGNLGRRGLSFYGHPEEKKFRTETSVRKKKLF